jgi:hypothetical protein
VVLLSQEQGAKTSAGRTRVALDTQLCSWNARESDSPAADRQARNIAKVAAARKLLTYVFYAMRDGHVRALDTPAAEHEAG